MSLDRVLDTRVRPHVGLLKALQESMSRDELFAGLCILGCANGLGSRAISSINDLGWESAVIHTFGISAFIWVACFLGVAFVLRDRKDVIRSVDLVVGAAVIVLVFVPIGGASWLALTGLCLYMLLLPNGPPPRRRGASILLATTVPMLWTGLLLHFLARPILEIDAAMIGWLLGTGRVGNMVSFADNSGYLVIFQPCSSVAGMSLAMLCWVTISQAVQHRPSVHDLIWPGLACASVIVVNISRISMMGLSEHYYQVAHGPLGSTIANAMTAILIVGFSLLGVRREIFSRI
jgi:exosortase/archaeosortase family protein